MFPHVGSHSRRLAVALLAVWTLWCVLRLHCDKDSYVTEVVGNVNIQRPLGYVVGGPSSHRCDMELRKSALLKYCVQHRKRVDLASKDVLIRNFIHYTMTLDEEHKTLYCSIPKVASSTWMAFLIQEHWPVENGTDIDWSLMPIHEPKFHVPLGINHLVAFSRKDMIRKLRSHFKFLVVRHPFERLVSAYYDKFIMTEYGYRQYYRPYIIDHFRHNATDQPLSFYEQQENYITEYLRNGTDIPEVYLCGRSINETIDEYWKLKKPDMDGPYMVTFSEFLQFVLSIENENEQDHHWLPIMDSCHPCAVHYDVIAKLETLDQDSYSIIKNLNISKQLRFQSLKHLRQSSEAKDTLEGNDSDVENTEHNGDKLTQRSTSSPELPSKLFTKYLPEFRDVSSKTIEQLLLRYRGDLEGFGYGFDMEGLSTTCTLEWNGETCC